MLGRPQDKTAPHDRNFAALTVVLTAAVIGIYSLMALRFPSAYLMGTYEDLYGEWLQFFLFAAAMLFSLRIVFSPSRYRLFFAFLALACFYVTMEEISWGQRIFGWSSPEFFKDRNIQGETNLHNLLVGPVRTTTKSLVEYVLAAALLLYGIVYPVLLRKKNGTALWLDGMGLASPSLSLAPCFAVAAFLELGPFMFNEAEVAEVLLGFAMTAMSLRYAAEARGRDNSAPALLLLTLAVAAALAAASTFGITSSPVARAKTEARVERGLEKFARRYARYEQWETAISLYEHLAAARPLSSSVRRSLAEAYREVGDLESYRHRGEEALALDLERLAERPSSPALNRSLAKTYTLLEEDDRAAAHTEKALEMDLAKVARYPESSSAAYSLALSYRLRGDDEAAFGEFRRAYEIDPGNRKYRKAWFAAKNKAR
jgi:tetratricopeptide (TPR) repeat protein